MPVVTLAEAQADLPAIIARLTPGHELCIIQGDHTIAKLYTMYDPDRPMIGKCALVELDGADDHRIGHIDPW